MSFNFFKYQRRFFSVLHNYRSKDNPKVFLDVSKNGQKLGRLVFEVIINFDIKYFINYSYIQIIALKLLLISKLYVLEKIQKN
jgi:hypothetical protein